MATGEGRGVGRGKVLFLYFALDMQPLPTIGANGLGRNGSGRLLQ